MATENSRWQQYLNALKGNFQKRTTLEFLQPDGSVAFTVDNNPRNPKSTTFIKEGQLSVNLQNGTRRNASIKLVNVDNVYDYNVNNIWFGTQVRLLMGLVLPNGEDYMIPQGVFYIKDPTETYEPNNKTVQLNLVDKWALLDGTLGGKLEGTYEVAVGSNIFEAIDGILAIQQGNGYPWIIRHLVIQTITTTKHRSFQMVALFRSHSLRILRELIQMVRHTLQLFSN